MGQHYLDANAASQRRLRDVVQRLDGEALARSVGADWTVSALLAHIAFWDQACVERWHEYDRSGSFVNLSNEAGELVNRASLPAWRAIPGTSAVQLVLEMAELADARTAALSDAAIKYARENDRAFILDRAAHRHAHLDEIERALGG